MNQKPNRLRRGMLLTAALALTAAVTVLVVRAYLTAMTTDKTNVFIPGENIRGEVIEPDYEILKASRFIPGDSITKNPMVDNDSPGVDVWVAAKVEFQIDVGAGYETVPYSLFSQVVSVANYVGDSGHGTSWVSMAALKAADDDVKNNALDYFFFNKLLAGQTETDVETRDLPTPTTTAGKDWSYDAAVLPAAQAQYATDYDSQNEKMKVPTLPLRKNFYEDDVFQTTKYNAAKKQYDEDVKYYKWQENGMTGSAMTDNSAPLFTSVTPSVNLTIDPTATSGYVANATALNTELNTNQKTLDKLFFKAFRFRIKVTAVGMKDEYPDSAKTDGALSGDTLAGAEEEIFGSLK